ncbi:MAG: AzlD domain-containing protein [Syntrophobacteraceae bacterium]|nr:AzlD domain-containing protein [Syntrophobacteraceae bacterium]
MPDAEYFGVILAMGLLTYLPRWMPLFVFSQKAMPGWLVEWLDLIPVAILSALVFPELLTHGAPRTLDILQAKSLVAVPTLLFALRTRSLGGTVVVGMLSFWALGKL